MTLAEAAERSACSPKTIRRAVDAGQLVAVRLGASARSDRIHPADLEDRWKQSRHVFAPRPAIAGTYPPTPPSHPRIKDSRRFWPHRKWSTGRGRTTRSHTQNPKDFIGQGENVLSRSSFPDGFEVGKVPSPPPYRQQ